MPKTVVTFDAIPGMKFSAPVPKTAESSVPYSQMQVGSDDTIRVRLHRDGIEVEMGIEVEHVKGESDVEIVGMAYRKLLCVVSSVVYREFEAARKMVVDDADLEQQREASL